MYITFRNNSTSGKMMISAENQKYIIEPESSVEVFCQSQKIVFEAQNASLGELTDMVNELDEEAKSYRFKDKMIAKLVKKFAEKLPELMLDISVKYEADISNSQNAVIDLDDGAYSVCDGDFADFIDMVPVGFIFSRAETDSGSIRVVDVTAMNRKKYLKLVRGILLFSHWGLFFVDLFFFIPEYLLQKIFSSHFFIKKLFVGLYNKPADRREKLLYKKEQMYEGEDKKGCLGGIIKVIIFLLLVGGICYWAVTSEPEVIISEDFQSIVCFDETFVKIDGGLPENAEDVFLEDYWAYYPLPDGGYDMDNYYCYIYETPDGTRYMWLKDNCSKEENADKDYDDYEAPLVYKSEGKAD